jgi:hypothetical protein
MVDHARMAKGLPPLSKAGKLAVKIKRELDREREQACRYRSRANANERKTIKVPGYVRIMSDGTRQRVAGHRRSPIRQPRLKPKLVPYKLEPVGYDLEPMPYRSKPIIVDPFGRRSYVFTTRLPQEVMELIRDVPPHEMDYLVC